MASVLIDTHPRFGCKAEPSELVDCLAQADLAFAAKPFNLGDNIGLEIDRGPHEVKSRRSWRSAHHDAPCHALGCDSATKARFGHCGSTSSEKHDHMHAS